MRFHDNVLKTFRVIPLTNKLTDRTGKLTAVISVK